MEFWGVEVKAGKPLKVEVEENTYLHISQASLGEIKKDNKESSAPLFVDYNGQKFAIGHLSAEKSPSIAFDLVFEKEFEISHNSKNGSVYFTGYTSEIVDDEESMGDSEEEEEPLLIPAENGKPEVNDEPLKAASGKAIANAKPVIDADEDSEEDDSDDSDEGDEDDDDSEDEDESDDEEETPKKVEVSKKRAHESASKTPVSNKKAKAATPEKKTDGKKGVHTATPHPAKKGGKTPATPKSAGQFSCSPCKKTFGSDTGLQSHNKAKHSAK